MRFDASYLFNSGGSRLDYTSDAGAPFEIKARASFITGIFRKKSGGGKLKVTVYSAAGADQGVIELVGVGEIVVLGADLGKSNKFGVQALDA